MIDFATTGQQFEYLGRQKFSWRGINPSTSDKWNRLALKLSRWLIIFLKLFYQIWKVVFKYLKNAFYLCSTLFEVAITFDRYFLIKSTSKNTVNKIDKIVAIAFTTTSLLIFLPVLFADTIESKEMYHYHLFKSELGKARAYSIYLTCVTFIQNILTVFIIIPFNLVVLCKYRRFMKKKMSTIARIMPMLPTSNRRLTIQKLTESQKRFTRMILIVSFVFILSRLGEASIKVADLLYPVFNSELYFVYFYILVICVEMNTCIFISFNFYNTSSYNIA